jgi:phage terminase large subunit
MNEKRSEILIPKEFARLLDSDWREAAVYGGRYSLKSGTVASILLTRAMNSKIRVGCFREYQNSIADSSHQLLKDIIDKKNLWMFKVTDNSIVNTMNGSDFLFKGLHHNIQSVKSIEGIDIAWIEEAQTVSEESLEVLTPTIRKKGSQLIYTYNRLRPKDPVHKRLVMEGRPNTIVINVNYDIAVKYGMIPDDILDEIEDDKINRPSLYRYKWLGDPENTENIIYNDWAEIESIPHEARLVRFGVDFGYTIDPTAIVAVYEYNGGYILDEIAYQKRLSNKMIADILTNQPSALVIGDSAEPKSIEEIKLYGINILGVVKGGDQKRQGIDYVQQQRISVTKHSKHIIESRENYIWAKDKDGNNINEPDDTVHEWSNSMDAIRYAFDSLRPKKEHKQPKRPERLRFHI